MQRTAPSPDGATMSWPSEVAPKPTSSARIVAPRACACSSASSTSMPPPPAMTKPSRAASKAREACSRPVVEPAGHGAHGVEQQRQLPALLLAAAGEDDVLLAPGDELRGVADAVRAGGAGRGDRVVDALDAEGRGQAGRDRAAHRARDHEGADALDALGAQRVRRPHLVVAGGPAGAGHQPGARVRDLLGRQAGMLDGLLHRQVGIGRRVAHEAQGAAVDRRFQLQRGAAADLAAQAALGIGRVEAQAGAAFAQALRHVLGVVAEAGDDALTGDDDSTHQKFSVDVNRPTLRSVAT